MGDEKGEGKGRGSGGGREGGGERERERERGTLPKVSDNWNFLNKTSCSFNFT